MATWPKGGLLRRESTRTMEQEVPERCKIFHTLSKVERVAFPSILSGKDLSQGAAQGTWRLAARHGGLTGHRSSATVLALQYRWQMLSKRKCAGVPA